MTREEILEAITDDKMMPFIQPEQLSEIVDFVIKNYKPSLPSNLDEAAIDIVTENGRFELTTSGKMRIEDIMFGAEWMAGQGASFNTEVGWIDGPTILDWLYDILDKFEMGDKIVVQIRKK